MCIVFFCEFDDVGDDGGKGNSSGSTRRHEFKYVLATNRDEDMSRPSSAAHAWPNTRAFGGLDERAGGTWLALRTNDRTGFDGLGVITNVRERVAEDANQDYRSRGNIIRDFAAGNCSAKSCAENIALQSYAGFNLLLVDSKGCNFVSNRGGDRGGKGLQKKRIPDGQLAAFSNEVIPDTWPWRKTSHGMELFERIVTTKMKHSEDAIVESLMQMLRNGNSFAAREDLPGILPQSDEEKMSRVCIPKFDLADGKTPYGTRTNTVVLVKKSGSVVFAEANRTLDAPAWELKCYRFGALQASPRVHSFFHRRSLGGANKRKKSEDAPQESRAEICCKRMRQVLGSSAPASDRPLIGLLRKSMWNIDRALGLFFEERKGKDETAGANPITRTLHLRRDETANTSSNAFTKLMHTAKLQGRKEYFSMIADGNSFTCSYTIEPREETTTSAWAGCVALKPSRRGGKPGKLYLSTNVASAAQGCSTTSGMQLSVLKSVLQKNVRRCRALQSVRTSVELARLDPVQFFRRIVIIAVEDCCVHPSLSMLVWVMAALSKGFVPPKSVIMAALAVVYEIANSKHGEAPTVHGTFPVAFIPDLELLGEKERKLAEKLISSKDAEDNERARVCFDCIDDCERSALLRSADIAMLRSLLLRRSFGGMRGDGKMLLESCNLWLLRFIAKDRAVERWRSIFDHPISDGEILERCWSSGVQLHDICLAGIDFHCVGPLIFERLPYERIHLQLKSLGIDPHRCASADFLKTCMWKCASSKNFRKPMLLGDETAANSHESLESKVWAVVAPYVEDWQRDYLRRNFRKAVVSSASI